MGGPNSGCHDHWWRPAAKRTVEDCLSLDANRWTRAGILKAGVWLSGVWTWTNTRTGERLGSVGFMVNTTDRDDSWVWLSHTVTKTGEREDYWVGLEATRPHLGGLRWWFVCPLLGRWGPCGRRIGKIYLPPGGRHYGCRHCHRLTYTRCQESRRFDMLWRLLAQRMNSDPATVKRVMHRLDKGVP